MQSTPIEQAAASPTFCAAPYSVKVEMSPDEMSLDLVEPNVLEGLRTIVSYFSSIAGK